MNEQLKPTIDFYVSKVEKLKADIEIQQNEMKRYMIMVNQLLVDAGESIKYEDVSFIAEPTPNIATLVTKLPESVGGGISVKTGEFYNRPLSKAAKEILIRGGGSMLFSEIIESLNKGGFQAKDERWVRNTLLKNKHFDILPDKRYMIYVAKGKSKKGKVNSNEDSKKEENGKENKNNK